MKFTATDINHIDEIPTQDSIIAVTDDSLLAYCADNTLHKVTKPDWHIVDEPNIGLIRDGILNTSYATRYTFGSNNGAGSCRAYQGENVYVLDCPRSLQSVWIRWKINFDDIAQVMINSKKLGYNYMNLRISDSEYNPASASELGSDSKALYGANVPQNECILDVSKYTGTHWMYIFTYSMVTWHLFDVELRKANES